MLLKRIGGEAASVATKTEAPLKQRMGHVHCFLWSLGAELDICT